MNYFLLKHTLACACDLIVHKNHALAEYVAQKSVFDYFLSVFHEN